MEINQVERRPVFNRFMNLVSSHAIIVIMLLLIIVVSIVQPRFLTADNFRNILNQIAVIGVLSCGMTFVLLIGCIDLSVGSQMSLVGIIAVMLTNKVGDGSAIIVPVIAGAFVGLIIGGIMAAINGRLGESFMVTYGMQSVLAALALIVSGNLFMMVESTGTFSKIGVGLNPVYVFFVLIVICQFTLTKTRLGRNIMFMGSNPMAAKLSGINVRLYTMLAFTFCGLITAMAGTLLPSRVMSANPTAGTNYELDAIAACVVGGISMKGGSGNFVNTLVGVLVIGVLGNALNLLGVTTYPQMIVKGFVIALAVTLDLLNKQRQLKRG